MTAIAARVTGNNNTEYHWQNSAPDHTEAYLWPTVTSVLQKSVGQNARVFDLGCGNGNLMKCLQNNGYEVVGVDPSVSGVSVATESGLHAEVGSAYDPLAEKFGVFPAVVSLEVVEHVYSPREYATSLFDLLEPSGTAIVSTPFHGYWKNLAIALTGKFDHHVKPLWDHGHIKFWSPATLSELLHEVGFESVEFHYAGRMYPFSKSMIAVARKPQK